MEETFASVIRENGENVWFYIQKNGGGYKKFPCGRFSPTARELGIFEKYPPEHFAVGAILHCYDKQYKICKIQIDYTWKKEYEIDVELTEID